MIPAKVHSDPFLISRIRERDMESIIGWFEEHQHSFYALARVYLTREQTEELFFQAIQNIHEGLPRFNKETSFERWATSIFWNECRELSVVKQTGDLEEHGTGPDIYAALNGLNAEDKSAIALTYIKGLSIEEAARTLQVEEEKVKERLFSGVRTLRNELGYGQDFKGCKEYHPKYIDYLGRNLGRPEKVEFEMHIYHCADCQDDLATYQDVMLTLTGIQGDIKAPADLMENVKSRLHEKEEKRRLKKKKRKRVGLAFAGIFALFLCTGFATGSFSNIYYSWTEEQEDLGTYLQQGLGERLNLEAESEGVKITIKSVIADDVQTLVFYEIEDTKKDNQYVLNVHEGVFVQNERELMNRDAYSGYKPPITPTDVHDEKNIYQGQMSLLPLSKESGTVQLNIKKLQKLKKDPEHPDEFLPWGYEEMEFASGEWNFEIPVTKHDSTEYELKQETEVEGIPVRLEKLIIAPTATILQYSYKHELPDKRIDILSFDRIHAGDRTLKSDIYNISFVDAPGQREWNRLQTQFESLYGEDIDEVTAQFGSIHMSVQDQTSIDLDVTKEYPQTFEYLGSTISIDKLEVGFPTEIIISNHELKDREFESLQFHVKGKDDYDSMAMGMNSEGVLVDKHGKEYDIRNTPFRYQEIEQPRYFQTVESFQLLNNETGEKVVPVSLEIEGYSTTKYVDDKIKLDLN
ncbi:DUF4179 domain-containing protein [Rossellomorea aquimaris]|uniref:DUF4179 domain-containing protein n=1 Tax=Rossellomorea aquimaris TaxID=189382 RepID=UPI001CD7DA2E|nr:DUF4179 domain-containing protein [Rossellomorea aquimaris]MCA1055778.1 DUF4179 domain-containing protein [Rossellomorea aquimaris]